MSPRTLLRDVRSLREAGVPLEFDRDAKRYSIGRGFFLPPTNFTASEALALLALASELGRDNGLPFFEPAYQAALKLEGNLPATLQQVLRALTPVIKIRLQPLGHLAEKQGVFRQLLDATAQRRVVRIDYESFTEWETIRLKLRPYHLLFSRHSWYVIGRSLLHREVRIFNLSRIGQIEILSETFRQPRQFNLERYLANAWHLMTDASGEQHVVIRFKPLVARNVAEVLWHRTQRTEMLEDGSLMFCATVSGLNEIVWWILGYGDQAEVLKPARLRRIVAQRARNMARMYEGCE